MHVFLWRTISKSKKWLFSVSVEIESLCKTFSDAIMDLILLYVMPSSEWIDIYCLACALVATIMSDQGFWSKLCI